MQENGGFSRIAQSIRLIAISILADEDLPSLLGMVVGVGLVR
jgi:hypothetical protein